jgi:hypothetical protein
MIETSSIGLVRLPSVTMPAPVINNGQFTLERLSAPRYEEDEDERPSAWAFDTTSRLVHDAGAVLAGDFPPGAISSDGAGRLRVEWKYSARQLRLVVPAGADGKSYIYHQDGGNFGIVKDLTAASLAGWLTWLTHDAS